MVKSVFHSLLLIWISSGIKSVRYVTSWGSAHADKGRLPTGMWSSGIVSPCLWGHGEMLVPAVSCENKRACAAVIASWRGDEGKKKSSSKLQCKFFSPSCCPCFFSSHHDLRFCVRTQKHGSKIHSSSCARTHAYTILSFPFPSYSVSLSFSLSISVGARLSKFGFWSARALYSLHVEAIGAATW